MGMIEDRKSTMGIEDRLNTFGSIMGAAQPSKDRPIPSKATEAVTVNLDRIVSGYNEIEHRLETMLDRFGGSTGEKEAGGSANATPPTTFLFRLNSSTMHLEQTLKRISMLLDRFEELV